MRAEINGTRIFFDIDGSGLRASNGSLSPKSTLIALHGGLGFEHSYLREGLGPLRSDAQVIYVDMRGQGRSGRPPLESCTLEQMADDVAGLCKYLEVERAFVFGHSAGGFVAMATALRHPTLVQGLVVCSSSPTVKELPAIDGVPNPTLASRASPDALAAAERVFNGEITQESIDAFLRHVGPLHSAPSNPDVFPRIFGATSATIEMMRHYMHVIAPTYDLRPTIGRIVAPTLVMFGRHDWICPPHASYAIANSISSSQLCEFEDSGHLLFSEEPGKFLRIMGAFLATYALRT